MLREAVREAEGGATVCVVMHSHNMVEYAQAIIRDVIRPTGAEYGRSLSIISTRGGRIIFIVPLFRDRLRGLRGKAFVDHTVSLRHPDFEELSRFSEGGA